MWTWVKQSLQYVEKIQDTVTKRAMNICANVVLEHAVAQEKNHLNSKRKQIINWYILNKINDYTSKNPCMKIIVEGKF